MDVVAYLSSNNVTVRLLLDPDGVFFNINTLPYALVTFNTSIVVLLYNTLYNVSIVPTLCGQTGATTLIQLKYSECISSNRNNITLYLIFYYP